MKIRIKSNVATLALMRQVNIPDAVSSQFIGQTFEVEDTNDVHLPATFVGKQSTWAIPHECIDFLPTTLSSHVE